MISQILVNVLPYGSPNVRAKFDNNQCSSFGNYLSNKNRQRQTNRDRQTDLQTAYETSTNHESDESPDGLDYYTYFLRLRPVSKNKMCKIKVLSK